MFTNRRQFLQLAVGAATASSLSSIRAAQAKSSARPLGFSLYGMKALPLTEAIDQVARIGYRQLEVSLIPGFPAEPAKFSTESRREVRKRIRERGLTIASLLININLAGDDKAQTANLEVIRRAAEVAHDLDPQHPPLVETVMGGKADEWEANKEKFATRLRAWVQTADAGNILLSVKAHAGQAVNSPQRLLWMKQRINHPRLALTYDYSHYQFEGFSLEESARAIVPFAKFIHVKDVVTGEKTPRYLLAGEGSIDYAKYFRLLDELKYTGPIIVEVSSQIHSRAGYDGVKAAEQTYAFLSRVLQGQA
jgi:sugar phosphate isomerase/epimerase